MTVPLYGQDDLTETFISPDNTARMRYPEGWRVYIAESGNLLLSNDLLSAAVLLPDMIAKTRLAQLTSAEALIEAIIPTLTTTGTIGEPEPITLVNGEGFWARLTPNEDFEDEFIGGFVMTLEIDGELVYVNAFVHEGTMEDLEAGILPIIETLELGEFDPPGTVTGDLPQLQDFFADGLDDVSSEPMAELETLGLVPEGGVLLLDKFNAMDMEVVEGELVPVRGLILEEESKSSYNDFVMAGLISFRPQPDQDSPLCGFLSHLTTDDKGDPVKFLFVGFNNTDEVVVVDGDLNVDEPRFLEVPSGVDIYSPQHLLYIARDGEITVFVNGQAVIERWPLTLSQNEDQQSVFVGTNLDPGCVISPVWAYGFPSD